MRALRLPLASLSLALAGCSLAPAYHAPSSSPPSESYLESADWKVAEPRDQLSRGEWWTAFDDSDLNNLEAVIVDGNQDIRAGIARLAQARALTRIARSSLLPTLNASASATRARISKNSPRYVPGSEPTGNDFDLQADLSYEIDLWGRIRNNVAAAKASQRASSADLAALILAIRAELATQYFTVRIDDAEQALLDRTVEDYERSLQLTQNLYQGGAAALADVAQAEAQLQSARTQAAEIRLQRA